MVETDTVILASMVFKDAYVLSRENAYLWRANKMSILKNK